MHRIRVNASKSRRMKKMVHDHRYGHRSDGHVSDGLADGHKNDGGRGDGHVDHDPKMKLMENRVLYLG